MIRVTAMASLSLISRTSLTPRGLSRPSNGVEIDCLHEMLFTILTLHAGAAIHYAYATTDAPTFAPTTEPSTFSPSFYPTPFPSASPTLFPTVYLQPKNLGYYYSETYFGITCNNIIGNEAALVSVDGNSFGNCLVAYNGTGYALESSSYVSTCTLDGSGSYYLAYYTEYYDTACQNPKSAPTIVYYPAGCSTSGDLTTQYVCSPTEKKPPYDNLSGGYVKGYTSTVEDCKNGLPHTFRWVKTKQCIDSYSSATHRNTSQQFSCDSDSIITVDNYYDGTCKKSVGTASSRVSLCKFQYYASDVYQNYIYAECQGSHTSSGDDDISMSEDDYGGVITGTLIAGMVIGAVLGAVILIFCCKFSKA
jgi:hypothetical protein